MLRPAFIFMYVCRQLSLLKLLRCPQMGLNGSTPHTYVYMYIHTVISGFPVPFTHCTLQSLTQVIAVCSVRMKLEALKQLHVSQIALVMVTTLVTLLTGHCPPNFFQSRCTVVRETPPQEVLPELPQGHQQHSPP